MRCCARSRRYYSFTSRPLCFADMRDKLRRRQYRTWGDLLADFELICDNALAYNNKRSRVHRAAATLQHAGQILLQVKRYCTIKIMLSRMCARSLVPTFGNQNRLLTYKVVCVHCCSKRSLQQRSPLQRCIQMVQRQQRRMHGGRSSTLAPQVCLLRCIDFHCDKWSSHAQRKRFGGSS